MISCVAVVVMLVAPETDAEKVTKARKQIQVLTRAANAYKLKFNKFPATLKDLIDAKFLEAKYNTSTDPWGKQYQYDPKGPKNGGLQPDVWTVGPDKKVIGNWRGEPDQ